MNELQRRHSVVLNKISWDVWVTNNHQWHRRNGVETRNSFNYFGFFLNLSSVFYNRRLNWCNILFWVKTNVSKGQLVSHWPDDFKSEVVGLNKLRNVTSLNGPPIFLPEWSIQTSVVGLTGSSPYECLVKLHLL